MKNVQRLQLALGSTLDTFYTVAVPSPSPLYPQAAAMQPAHVALGTHFARLLLLLTPLPHPPLAKIPLILSANLLAEEKK